MKAFFASNDRRAINPQHRHDAHLEGQMVVIDCKQKRDLERTKTPVRIDLYKKGQKSYYCCLWIHEWVDERELFITGSGKANSRFGAVYAALDSAGISFDHPLPELGINFDVQVWEKLDYVVKAVAEAIGVEKPYIHHCLRSN